MSMFEGAVLDKTVATARLHRIEPEALLAVVEVESAGRSLEIDGKTPCLLFERHVFYRELDKAKKDVQLGYAVAAGLAIPKWSPATQYKDQGSSNGRLKLLAQARALDNECALRSCSFGVGQTCGFLAEELHFADAIHMYGFLVDGGVTAQVDCMIREIENKHLSAKLNAHDWSGFARIYNGPGYARNNYDAKMEIAYRRWLANGLEDVKPVPPPAPQPAPPPRPQKGFWSGVAAAFVALGLALKTLNLEVVFFLIFIGALLIATGIIIWRRHKDNQIVQLGVLTTVEDKP